MKNKKISKEDVHLYKITNSVEEAVHEIYRFYSNYHSMRYVGDQLVLRVQNPVEDSQLRYLNNKFSDILKSGKFTRSSALKEEANQPNIKDLPRILFHFNRINNGRMRQIIDFLNKS
jgi:hypothetical protein